MLTKLAKKINNLASSGKVEIVEEPSYLKVEGVLSAALLEDLQGVLSVAESWFKQVFFVDVDEGENFSKTDLNSKIDSQIRINFIKPIDGDVFFFTKHGFQESLGHKQVLAAKNVRINALFGAFRSETTTFTNLEDELADGYETDIYDKPRKLIADVVGDILPEKFGPWLLRGDAPEESEVFAAWRYESALKLSYVFCSELYRRDNQVVAVVSGLKKNEARFTQPSKEQVVLAFPVIQEAARWILETEREVRTRQKYLAGELAREWRGDLDWFSGLNAYLKEAFVSARLAFESFFDKEARDSLKALSDLKKAVSDTSLQIANQTQTLIHQVSNDFAIVFGAILARHAVMAANAANHSTSVLACMFVVCFVLLRMTLSIKSASAYISNQKKAREAWNKKIHFYLTQSDFNDLAVNPINDSERSFYSARKCVFFAYLFLIALLLLTWWGIDLNEVLNVMRRIL